MSLLRRVAAFALACLFVLASSEITLCAMQCGVCGNPRPEQDARVQTPGSGSSAISHRHCGYSTTASLATNFHAASSVLCHPGARGTSAADLPSLVGATNPIVTAADALPTASRIDHPFFAEPGPSPRESVCPPLRV